MMDLPARELMEFDVVVVGAGPAGLAAAIRLKQDAAAKGGEISVVVVEKGSEVGAHILSGAVIDPSGLDALLPDWRNDGDRPLKTPVTEDQFLYLGPAGGVRLPNMFMPKLMNNHGNFIGSLGNVDALSRPQGDRGPLREAGHDGALLGAVAAAGHLLDQAAQLHRRHEGPQDAHLQPVHLAHRRARRRAAGHHPGRRARAGLRHGRGQRQHHLGRHRLRHQGVGGGEELLRHAGVASEERRLRQQEGVRRARQGRRRTRCSRPPPTPRRAAGRPRRRRRRGTSTSSRRTA